jgi:hypothetical protein
LTYKHSISDRIYSGVHPEVSLRGGHWASDEEQRILERIRAKLAELLEWAVLSLPGWTNQRLATCIRNHPLPNPPDHLTIRMLPPILADPTFVVQELARVENRLSVIKNPLRQLVALLSTTRDTRTFHYEDQHAALVKLFTRTNIPLSLIRSPEFIRYAHVTCPGFSRPSFPELRQEFIGKADAGCAFICPTSENGDISFKIVCERDSRTRKTSASSFFLSGSRRVAVNGIAVFLPEDNPRTSKKL